MSNYDFNNSDTKTELEALQRNFERLGEVNSAEGNETERSLSGQLILLTTVLITVNVLVLGDGSIVSKITPTQKNYIFCALLLEAAATMAGVLNYLRIERSFDEWAKIWYKCASIVKKRKDYKNPDELTKLLDAEQAKIHDKRRFALWIQVGAIVLSLGMYLLLVHSLFFSMHSR